MTPDRLVDFIPSILAKFSPPPLPENPGDVVELCRWFDTLTHANNADTPTGIQNPLWPRPPQIAVTTYTLNHAARIPQLILPPEIPVTFCNYPGNNFRGELLPTLEQCVRVADCVIAANGELAFSRTDFELPGPFPFRWQRFYRQSSDTAFGLGNGWRHTLSESLQLPDIAGDSERKVILHTAEGRAIAFDLPAIGHASFNRCERLYLLRQSLHSFRICGFSIADKIFRADGTGQSAPLCEIRDGYGNTLSVDYRGGKPHRIITSWGRTLECIFDGDQLTKIINPITGDDTSLFRYIFNDEQQLIGVDTGNNRETYNYENGLLSSLTSHAGSIRFFFDRIGRCHLLYQNDLKLEIHWQASRRLCTVTSSDQHDIQWQFDDRGDLIKERQEQREARFLYDHYRNLCLCQESDGQRTLFRHDEFGRLVRRTRNGKHKRFTYDSQGRLHTTTTTAPDTEVVRWTFSYGDKAQPTVITDPTGLRWLCDYDDRGQLRQLTDPESGRTMFQWDGQSQLQVLQRGESSYRLTYDASGRLTGCKTDYLPMRSWQYDKKGALITSEVGGKRFTFIYDEQGRPCTISESIQGRDLPLLQWQYDERSLVRHVRFADHAPWNLHYTPRGQLCALEIDDNQFRWCYDRFGLIQEFTNGTGRQREWLYDPSGRVSEYRDSDNHWYLEYRADGALEQIRNNNGQHCRFHFDEDGRLLQASNNYCHQRFRYDNRNRLTAEHHDITIDNRRESLSINHDYDARGWLRASGSENINIAYIFAASGALYGMDVNGEMLLRSERESSADESDNEAANEYWNLGEHKLIRQFIRGELECIGLGKEFQWQTDVPEIQSLPDLIIARTEPTSPNPVEQYDQRGNVIREIRTTAGERLHYDYQFDGWGLMHSVECGDFSTYFRYDPFGRRLAKTSSHRRSRRQRRVSSYWSSLGLWHEASRLDDSRTTAHYLHHPRNKIPLARLTRVSEQTQAEGKTTREQRDFYIADDTGRLLALMDADAPELPPLWHRQQESASTSRGPGSFRGADGIFDGETQLFYRDFSYWHATGNNTPLDAGQHRLLITTQKPPSTIAGSVPVCASGQAVGTSLSATEDDAFVTKQTSHSQT